MKSRHLVSVLVALLMAGTVGVLSSLSIGERLEQSISDLWFGLRPAISPSPDIVVVAIDESSYGTLNVPLTEPWPRRLHAQLIEKLKEYGAKRLVFDILFLDQGKDPQADDYLARSLAAMPTILGIEATQRQIASSAGTFTVEDILEPFAPFAKSSAAQGLVGLPEDGGYVRRFLTDRSERTKDYPTLSEAAAGMSPGDSRPRPGPRDMINFYGANANFGTDHSFRTLSYDQILQTDRKLPASTLKDKIVFVGLELRSGTGPQQKDAFRTPFGDKIMYGVEIHATAAANLLQGNWIHRASASSEVTWLSIAAFILTLLVMEVGPLVGALLVVGSALAWAGISFTAFTHLLYFPGFIVVGLAAPFIYSISTAYFYFVARKAGRHIQSALAHYLSPEMVAQLSAESSAIALGGTTKWATALFTDIEDFTSITEDMPASRVAEMLNAYFTEVMEVAFQNQGTLIKFIGDSVFLLWGAPVPLQNHAELGLKTALLLRKEVEKFNKSGRFPPLHTRIGINTGPMVVGNLGSKRRFDFTAIGDSVNLASRLEGVNKFFGTTILFSETTRKEAGPGFDLVRLGSVKAKGKKEPVTLYTIFEAPLGVEVLSCWETALEAFTQRRWDAARSGFNEVLKIEPRLEKACHLYLGEIDARIKDGGEDYSGGALEFYNK